jgi:hypothetical protein
MYKSCLKPSSLKIFTQNSVFPQSLHRDVEVSGAVIIPTFSLQLYNYYILIKTKLNWIVFKLLATSTKLQKETCPNEHCGQLRTNKYSTPDLGLNMFGKHVGESRLYLALRTCFTVRIYRLTWHQTRRLGSRPFLVKSLFSTMQL